MNTLETSIRNRLGVLVALGALLAMPAPVRPAPSDCRAAKLLYDQGVASRDYRVKAEIYQRAVGLCPSYAEAHNNLADAYEHQGRFEMAVGEYEEARRLGPSLAAPSFGLGDVYFTLRLYKEAIAAYEAGLILVPWDKRSLRNLRKAKERLGEGEEVIPAGKIVDALKNGMALMGPAGRTRRRGEKRVRFHQIFFDFDSARLRKESGPQLNEIGRALVRLSGDAGRRLLVEGHTDNTGDADYNLGLSRRRAESVRHYLTERFPGVGGMLLSKGYGEERPIAPNINAAGRRLNRRVAIRWGE